MVFNGFIHTCFRASKSYFNAFQELTSSGTKPFHRVLACIKVLSTATIILPVGFGIAWAAGRSLQGRVKSSPFSDLPNELLFCILSEVVLSKDRRPASVCKSWNEIVSSLPHPLLTIFGPREWRKQFGLEIAGKIPELPQNIHTIVHPISSRCRANETPLECSLLLMPQGLTLNTLKSIAQKPLEGGYPVQFDPDSSEWVFAALGDKEVEQTYWVLMTNDVVPATRLKSSIDREPILKRKGGADCQVPRVLEVCVCAFFHRAAAGKYLFSGSSFTACQETIDSVPVFIGGFDSKGLMIDTGSSLLILCGSKKGELGSGGAFRSFPLKN